MEFLNWFICFHFPKSSHVHRVTTIRRLTDGITPYSAPKRKGSFFCQLSFLPFFSAFGSLDRALGWQKQLLSPCL